MVDIAIKVHGFYLDTIGFLFWVESHAQTFFR